MGCWFPSLSHGSFLTRIFSHTDLFPHGSFPTRIFSHTDLKDFKDGYALRYAGMLHDTCGVNRSTLGNNDSNFDTIRCCLQGRPLWPSASGRVYLVTLQWRTATRAAPCTITLTVPPSATTPLTSTQCGALAGAALVAVRTPDGYNNYPCNGGRPQGPHPALHPNRSTFGNNDANFATMRCCSERGGRGIIVPCKVPIYSSF